MTKQYKVQEDVKELIMEARANSFQDYSLEDLVKARQEIHFNLKELNHAKTACEDTTKKHLIENGLTSFLSVNYPALNRHLRGVKRSD